MELSNYFKTTSTKEKPTNISGSTKIPTVTEFLKSKL